MNENSVSAAFENDPQINYLIIKLFDKYIFQPTAHLPITEGLRENLYKHLQTPLTDPDRSGEHKLLEEEHQDYTTHFHNFFVDVIKEIRSNSVGNKKNLKSFLNNLLVEMQAELEYPPGRLDELLENSQQKNTAVLKRVLNSNQLPEELVNLLQIDWRHKLKSYQTLLAEEKACQIVDEQSKGKRLDLRILVSNLFAGSLIMSLVAGAAPQFGKLGYLILTPFIIFGLLCTYLWIIKDSRILAAFLTGFFTLSLVALSLLSLNGSTSDLLQPAFVAAGCGLGGLLGLYSGWWEWRYQMDQILLDRIFEIRDELLQQDLLHPHDLAAFGTEKVFPLLENAKSSIIREINQSMKAMESCAQPDQNDFESLFEVKKITTQLNQRILLLQAIMDDFEMIMTRLKQRVDLLQTVEVNAFNPYPLHLEEEHQEAALRITDQVQSLFLTELDNVLANIRYVISNPSSR